MRRFFVVTGMVAIALGGGSSAAAQWLRYQDPRFGTSTVYPNDLFTEQTATEIGATFSGGGGSLEISAAHRDVYSIQELRNLIARPPGTIG